MALLFFPADWTREGVLVKFLERRVALRLQMFVAIGLIKRQVVSIGVVEKIRMSLGERPVFAATSHLLNLGDTAAFSL